MIHKCQSIDTFGLTAQKFESQAVVVTLMSVYWSSGLAAVPNTWRYFEWRTIGIIRSVDL